LRRLLKFTLRSITNTVSGLSHQVEQDLWQYYPAFQTEQNSGAYVFRPEQNCRLMVGSNNNYDQLFKSSNWQFVYPYSSSASLGVLLTPVASSTYTDTFAASLQTVNPTQGFSISSLRLMFDPADLIFIAATRADNYGSASDPWFAL
jgi:hypothetical protein